MAHAHLPTFVVSVLAGTVIGETAPDDVRDDACMDALLALRGMPSAPTPPPLPPPPRSGAACSTARVVTASRGVGAPFSLLTALLFLLLPLSSDSPAVTCTSASCSDASAGSGVES